MTSHLKKCERERKLERIRGKANGNGNGRKASGRIKLKWRKGDSVSVAYEADPLVLAVGIYGNLPAGPYPHAFIISKGYGDYTLRLLMRMAEVFNVTEELGTYRKLADAKREAQRLVDTGAYRRVPGDWWDKHDPRHASPDPEVEEWRTELLEASDQGERYVLGYNEKVFLGPVLGDLEPSARRWLRGLMKHKADSDADAMKLDAYRDRLTDREQEIIFRSLDEQIRSASPAQILEYKRKAIEA